MLQQHLRQCCKAGKSRPEEVNNRPEAEGALTVMQEKQPKNLVVSPETITFAGDKRL